MLEVLGPVNWLLVDIPGLSWLENKAGDLVLGEKLEAARAYVSQINLHAGTFEQHCEEP